MQEGPSALGASELQQRRNPTAHLRGFPMRFQEHLHEQCVDPDRIRHDLLVWSLRNLGGSQLQPAQGALAR